MLEVRQEVTCQGGDLDDVGVLVVEGDLRSRRALVRLVDAMSGYAVVAESADPAGRRRR